MMLHSEMNQFLQGFGPATSLASGCSEHFLLKHQNSFEDEVESIYFSDLKKQQQQQDQHQQDGKMAAAVAASAGPITSMAAAAAAASFNEFQMVRPEDVTGQTIAVKLEDSEDDVIKANFDLSTLLDHEDDLVEDMIASGDDDNGDVMAEGDRTIAEMQEFLGRFEGASPPDAITTPTATTTIQDESSSTDVLPDNLAEELLSMEQRHTLESMKTQCPDMTDYDSFQAEMLLDMLLETVPEPQQQTAVQHQQTDILQEAMRSQNLHDSGFMDQEEEEEDSVVVEETPTAITTAPVATIPRTYNVSNVSQFQTADGKKVIIVIQPATASPAVAQQQPAVAPAVQTEDDSSSDVVVEDSDSDWTPEDSSAASSRCTATSKRKPGRKPEARVTKPVTHDGRVAKRSYRGVKDRKERKKLQNVEAARRYRDKKKQEQSEKEDEEKILMDRNKELKAKLADVENEFKTMKKLMRELGLNFVK